MPPAATPSGFRTPAATTRRDPEEDGTRPPGANVTVAVRMKPAPPGAEAITTRKSEQILLRNQRGEKKQFAFDHVFDVESHSVRTSRE